MDWSWKRTEYNTTERKHTTKYHPDIYKIYNHYTSDIHNYSRTSHTEWKNKSETTVHLQLLRIKIKQIMKIKSITLNYLEGNIFSISLRKNNRRFMI